MADRTARLVLPRAESCERAVSRTVPLASPSMPLGATGDAMKTRTIYRLLRSTRAEVLPGRASIRIPMTRETFDALGVERRLDVWPVKSVHYSRGCADLLIKTNRDLWDAARVIRNALVWLRRAQRARGEA